MKKLLIVCALVLLSGAGSALAQPAYQFADAGTKNFITEDTIAAGGQISLDLWLTNADAPPECGGCLDRLFGVNRRDLLCERGQVSCGRSGRLYRSLAKQCGYFYQ